MHKTANLNELLAKYHRATGSVGGPAAPAPFRHVGGPLTGALVQGALVGIPSYYLTKWLMPHISKKYDPDRMAIMNGLLGLGAGIAGNWNSLRYNWTQSPDTLSKLKNMNRNPGTLEPLPEAVTAPPVIPRPAYKTPLDAVHHQYGMGRYDMSQYGFPKSNAYQLGEKMAAFMADDPTGAIMNYRTFLPMEAQGPMIPVHYTAAQIDNDPYLSPLAKARLIGTLEAAGEGRTGLLGWQDLSRAAVGAGMGYAGATLFGKVMGGLFGELAPKTQKRLQQVGVIAGILGNTGIIGGR